MEFDVFLKLAKKNHLKNLSYILLNSQSFKTINRARQIEQLVRVINRRVDLIFLTETWVADSDADEMLQLYGYKLIAHSNKNCCPTGSKGVAIFIANNMHRSFKCHTTFVDEISQKISKHSDVAWIGLQIGDQKFMFGVLYRHQEFSNSEQVLEFTESVTKQLQYLETTYKGHTRILLGDLQLQQFKNKQQLQVLHNRFRSFFTLDDGIRYAFEKSKPGANIFHY